MLDVLVGFAVLCSGIGVGGFFMKATLVDFKKITFKKNVTEYSLYIVLVVFFSFLSAGVAFFDRMQIDEYKRWVIPGIFIGIMVGGGWRRIKDRLKEK